MQTPTIRRDSLAIHDHEVPDGFIYEYSTSRKRRTRFAVAVPMVVTALGMVTLSSVALIVAGANGWLVQSPQLWNLAVPMITVASIAVGVRATRFGWEGAGAHGPWGPMAYGLLAGGTWSALCFAVLQSMATLS